MANAGTGKFKGKPTIAVEQAVNGAGAKPNAAASMHASGRGGRRDADEGNISRNRKHGAPDHRVPAAHKPVNGRAEGRYTEPSR